jgi:hypothetical protein
MEPIIYLNSKKFEDQKSYISKHLLGIVHKNIVISQIEGKGRGLPIQKRILRRYSMDRVISLRNEYGMIHFVQGLKQNKILAKREMAKREMAKWEDTKITAECFQRALEADI